MRVAVLGAGLQGSCLALELARRGVDVDLYDRHERPMVSTSAHNEGKVHLGYVYAADRTRRTAATMVQGALAFAPLLRSWLGDTMATLPVSSPFNYVVHRDSLVSVADVEQHLGACAELARDRLAGAEPDYFGRDPRIGPERLTPAETERLYDPRLVRAAFRTCEVAVDPTVLAILVGDRLERTPRVSRRMRTEVLAVTPASDHAVVEARRDGGPTSDPYDHVVNALWSGRLAIDATAGLATTAPWLHRIRYNLRIRVRVHDVPATTMVLGPFGDVVSWGDHGIYLSWYPVGRRGSSADLVPPEWPVVLDAAAEDELRTAIHAALGAIVPSIAALPRDVIAGGEVRGSVVVARGESDIDDPASALHERHAIGPQSHGRYHSVDTGKLTMAPWFARLLVDRVLGPEDPR